MLLAFLTGARIHQVLTWFSVDCSVVKRLSEGLDVKVARVAFLINTTEAHHDRLVRTDDAQNNYYQFSVYSYSLCTYFKHTGSSSNIVRSNGFNRL